MDFRKVLVDNLNDSKGALERFSVGLREQVKEVIDKWVYELKILAEVHYSLIGADFVFKDDNREYRFKIIVEKNWKIIGDDLIADRLISLSPNTFGSFECDETVKCDFYVAFGKIAEKFKEISDDLRKLDWKTYDILLNSVSQAREKLEEYDNKVEEKRIEVLRNTLYSKIGIGTIIEVHKETGYSSAKTKTIEWISKSCKNVSFKFDWGKRTSMDDLLHNLVTGKWRIVEKEKLSTIDNK